LINLLKWTGIIAGVEIILAIGYWGFVIWHEGWPHEDDRARPEDTHDRNYKLID